MAATNIEVWQIGTVVEAEDITAKTRRLVLEQSRPMKAEPGSHIDVMVSINGEQHRRSYSIVDSSGDGRRVAISVFRAPQSRGGSHFMQALEQGDRVEITQPLQNFPLRIGAPRYVLLAGGIGITAMINMARVLRNIKADYTFVYAGRSRPAMAYLAQLEQLHGDALRVHVDDEGTALNVDELLATIEPDTELYMCGPIRLMDAVKRGWDARALNVTNLRYETFGNSGWFDPEEFVVRVPRLGVEATVPAGKSMLEALEDAGVDMMFDCRKGECGLCEVRLLGLRGSIDHRDVFYSERQQHSAAKMCCCVSRAVSLESGTRADSETSCAIVTIDV